MFVSLVMLQRCVELIKYVVFLVRHLLLVLLLFPSLNLFVRINECSYVALVLNDIDLRDIFKRALSVFLYDHKVLSCRFVCN